MNQKEDVLDFVRTKMRATFDELIKQHHLDCKDELQILQMLTADVSKNLVGTVTIVTE